MSLCGSFHGRVRSHRRQRWMMAGSSAGWKGRMFIASRSSYRGRSGNVTQPGNARVEAEFFVEAYGIVVAGKNFNNDRLSAAVFEPRHRIGHQAVGDSAATVVGMNEQRVDFSFAIR